MFLKEIKIIKGKYIKEKKFVFKVVEINVINLGFFFYLFFYGYIVIIKKDFVISFLVSDEDELILIVWRYGFGKVVVWCLDLSG